MKDAVRVSRAGSGPAVVGIGLALLICVPQLDASEPYVSATVHRRGRLTVGVGMMPLTGYEARGLFFEDVIFVTSLRPDCFASLGLGRGVEAGLRWGFMPGLNGHVKMEVSRDWSMSTTSCVTATGSWHRFGLRDGALTAWSVWAGYIWGSEWHPGRKYGVPFMIAGSAGLAGGTSSVAGEATSVTAFCTCTTVGSPMRIGPHDVFRISPEIRMLGSSLPIVLGYEDVFGVLRVPIESHLFITFGIGISYVGR